MSIYLSAVLFSHEELPVSANEISGLTLRIVPSGEQNLSRWMFYTVPVSISEVGEVIHCWIAGGDLDTPATAEFLRGQGFEVLTDKELDCYVEHHSNKVPPFSINALGTHWKENGQQVVRRYAVWSGVLTKSLGIYKQNWGQGHWFSCKISAPPK